ncbi:Histidine protein kinase DivJ [compost metagenome]
MSLLQKELPVRPEWLAVYTDDQYVRLRNIVLPGHEGFTVQVGLVLDRNFLNWEIIDSRLKGYVSGIVLALILASILLTLVLLSPLRILIGHLRDVTSSLVNMKDVRPLPSSVLKFTRNFWTRSDEFSSLVSIVQRLIDRINQNYKLTRSWTLQMAHELKTPLAIIQVETAERLRSGQLPDAYAQAVFSEINQMSEIINQFLDWAELENSHLQKELHALRIKTVVRSVATRLDKISPGRLQFNIKNDISIFANPIHLDQLVTNLVTNALKFSHENTKVELIVADSSLTVKDYGPGISDEVRERLGEPFNVGEDTEEGKTGNGLGLAWISTVAKLYQWEFILKSDRSGTEATIRFPKAQVSVS